MVTVDELKRTAALAALSLEDADIDALLSDLSDVIDFAGTIAEAQIPSDTDDMKADECDLRDDIILPSYDRALLLSNTNESDGRYFLVKKRRCADDDD